MRIISKHKDFYDYLQYQYGQDLNIYWKRDFLIPFPEDKIFTSFLYQGDVSSSKEQEYICIYNLNLHDLGRRSYYQYRYLGVSDYMECLSFSWRYEPKPDYKVFYVYISILGKVYPLIRLMDRNKKTIFFKTLDYETIQKVPSKVFQYPKKLTEDNFNSTLEEFKSLQSDILINIHRKYRTPIFLYTFSPETDYKDQYPSEKIYIRRRYPLLTDFQGLVNEIGSPEDLYKGIYNFFIELKSNKDIEPPVELNNKEKIVKAGFDLKQSFRHRKD